MILKTLVLSVLAFGLAAPASAVERRPSQDVCKTCDERPSTRAGVDECLIDTCNMVPYADNDMADILNSCHLDDTEGCVPWGNSNTYTHSYTTFYGYCDYPAATLNAYIDQISDVADANRPNNNWMVTGYELIYLGSAPPYGFQYRVKVHYENMICEAEQEVSPR